MNKNDDMLSFMDFLDLDEEFIDERLKTIMLKDKHSNKNLTLAMQLIKYKQLIYIQDDAECDNDQENNFIAKLIRDTDEETNENICKIVNIVLNLSPSTIVSKSEHLLQQILTNLEFNLSATSDNVDENNSTKILLSLCLCDSILDAVIKNGQKVHLPFLEVPLENILPNSNERLKMHFLTNTVPRFFEGVIGYAILDRIWNYLKVLKNEEQQTSLKVLSCLSNFYLPIQDNKGNIKYESKVVYYAEFWNIVLFGLMSSDAVSRKIAVYLAKRSIDCISSMRKNIQVLYRDTKLFFWETDNDKKLKNIWDSYFILIDSLEEKQSNIVLPSLQLFSQLNNIGDHWLNSVFNIGLKHDNAQVRLKCIDYRLDVRINSTSEALVLLEALNDLSLYDLPKEFEKLNMKLANRLTDANTFSFIFQAMPLVKWSPVPFYFLSCILANMNLEITEIMLPEKITEIVNDLLKIPCNHLAARKALHINISQFVGKCCKGFKWRDYANIYPTFKFQAMPEEVKKKNMLLLNINDLILTDNEKTLFFKLVSDSHVNVEFGLLYLDNNEGDIISFIDIINGKISKLHDIVNRQYSNKIECYNDAIYIAHLYRKTLDRKETVRETIHLLINREIKILLQYILCMIAGDFIISIDENKLFFEEISAVFHNASEDLQLILLQIYTSSVMVLKDEYSELNNKVFCTFVVANLTSNCLLKKYYKHEMFDLKGILNIVTKFEFGENRSKESIGRLKNVIYEKSCEIIHYLIEDKEEVIKNLKEIENYIENVIECGGYGCLRWMLQIVNKILSLLGEETINFNVTQFINKSWREIEELKSNNQYSPCMNEFVQLITQDALLKNSTYNNVILFFCNKIVEYGPMKNTPLFYLVRQLNTKDINEEYSQVVYIICEILLFSPVPRKDQRIAENVAVDILHNSDYGVNPDQTGIHFNFQILFRSILILCKISDPKILEVVSTLIMNKINKMLVNKCMYHGNSQPHRTLMNAVQHLLLILILRPKNVDFEKTAGWCMDLLGKISHQPSVRIMLEWYIALHLYIKKLSLNQGLLDLLKIKKLPMQSQFNILYWVLKHKISNATYTLQEFEFVMGMLLSHTMGQMFVIRLQAQYLASKLYKSSDTKPDKYAYVIEIIENTFVESCKDKNFIKLRKDYFANDFDIVNNATSSFIYYFLPRYCEINHNENVDIDFIKNVLKDVNRIMDRNDDSDDFVKEWKACHVSDEDIFKLNMIKNSENAETVVSTDNVGTIQKKYVPWKNMSDIDVYEVTKKRESPSDLIVVATLIDKLPNLGGMARTSEVFGVKTYVVDSLRHLQDKQFQGLSVSAERWIDIEEVRPGAPLKGYLMKKKAEGYSVVAAEQTSSSFALQSFKFPKKTLLLLGHEKEGIPCDLLPMMDYCVEIPQQGFVRSLNVHVTAAIFVWEYARQNFL